MSLLISSGDKRTAMVHRSRKHARLGKTGIYSQEPNALPCGSMYHKGDIFTPICFICAMAIGRTVRVEYWKNIHNNALGNKASPPLKEDQVAWTQRYRAIIFNLDDEIFLSEVDEIIYLGPWLEMLQLPVRNEETGIVDRVKFYPLCLHFNEREDEHNTFGCTVHATCWDFLEIVFGKQIQKDELSRIAHILRARLTPHYSISVDEKKKFFPGDCVQHPIDPSLPWGLWDEAIVHNNFSYYFDPKNIRELRALYRSCKNRSYKNVNSRCLRSTDKKYSIDYPLLERLYAAMPAEIKILIVEHVEGRQISTKENIGNTLPEYWRSRTLRRYMYPHIFFDAETFGIADVDWKFLYYNLGRLQSVVVPSNGWLNRRRIFNILCRTQARFAKGLGSEIKPSDLISRDLARWNEE